jgi:hypothetical protein
LPSSPRKKKPQQDRAKGKAMLELFVDSSGIVHVQFIPEGATINKHRYKQILCRLRSSVCCKSSELWCRKNWLCYMTMPLHSALCSCKGSWQNSRSQFCHALHTSHHVIYFSFSPSEKSYIGVDFSRRGDCHFHKGSHT